MKFCPKILWGFLFLALAGCGNNLTVSSKVDPASCESFMASLPSDVVRAFIEVPEDSADPSSPKLQIFYYYRGPLKGQVTLFLNGGPGSSSHSSYRVMERSLNNLALRDQVSFIFMDQRGTGCSTGYPESVIDESHMFERDRLYGSRGIVEDAELLRRHILGDAKWSIFGQSYGAFISHRYQMLYPQSLEKNIAYANVISSDPAARISNRLQSQIPVWEAYFAKYPDDRARVQLLIEKLSKTECLINSQNMHICGLDLVSPFPDEYLGFLNEWDLMHRWLTHLVANGSLVRSELQLFADRHFFPSPGRNVPIATSTIDFYDRNVPPMDFDFCKQESDKLKQRVPSIDMSTYLTECGGVVQFEWKHPHAKNIADYFGARNDWMTLSAFKQSLTNALSPKFFLYSGALDPYVPVSNFPDEASLLGNLITYRNFADAGHEGFETKKEVFDDLLN